MSIVTTPAVLLRSHAYGETSRILRFYTMERGLVGVMARGVRKEGSRGGSSLDTFVDGTLTLHLREQRELQTFRDFSARRSRASLGKSVLRLTGAALLAEIVLTHSGEEGHAELFHHLLSALDRIEETGEAGLAAAILAGAWRTVGILGYAPSVMRCVACGRKLEGEEVGRFDFGAGGVRCGACGPGRELPRVGPVARTQLALLVEGSAPEGLRGPAAHLRILGGFIDYHLSARRSLRTLPLLAAHFGTDDP